MQKRQATVTLSVCRKFSLKTTLTMMWTQSKNGFAQKIESLNGRRRSQKQNRMRDLCFAHSASLGLCRWFVLSLALSVFLCCRNYANKRVTHCIILSPSQCHHLCFICVFYFRLWSSVFSHIYPLPLNYIMNLDYFAKMFPDGNQVPFVILLNQHHDFRSNGNQVRRTMIGTFIVDGSRWNFRKHPLNPRNSPLRCGWMRSCCMAAFTQEMSKMDWKGLCRQHLNTRSVVQAVTDALLVSLACRLSFILNYAGA